MAKYSLILGIILMLVMPTGTVLGQESDCNALVLINAWARPSVTETGAVYGWVINLSNEDVVLHGARTDSADVVEVHSMHMGENDVMIMKPISDGVSIPAGRAIDLMSGGTHMMLIGLQDMLEIDEVIDLTLDFDNEKQLEVTVPIIDRETEDSHASTL